MPGYEKTHEISNLGRVRSFYATNMNKKVPFIIKTYTSNTIIVCRCYNENGVKTAYVAKEVLRAFGQEKDGVCSIRYLDGDKTNCKFSNLRYTNRRRKVVENVSDRSCKKCAFYKCFPEQDDGVHFKIDYAIEGCGKYVEKSN